MHSCSVTGFRVRSLFGVTAGRHLVMVEGSVESLG